MHLCICFTFSFWGLKSVRSLCCLPLSHVPPFVHTKLHLQGVRTKERRNVRRSGARSICCGRSELLLRIYRYVYTYTKYIEVYFDTYFELFSCIYLVIYVYYTYIKMHLCICFTFSFWGLKSVRSLCCLPLSPVPPFVHTKTTSSGCPH